MQKPSIVFYSLLCMFGNLAQAQTADLAQKASAMLTNFGPVPFTTTTNVPHTQRVCTTRHTCSGGGGGGQGGAAGGGRDCGDFTDCHDETTYTSVPQTQNVILSASNIRIVEHSPIQWGNATHQSLPNELHVDNSIVRACQNSPAPITHTSNLQVQYARTSTIQLLNSVTHSHTYTISFDTGTLLKFKVGAQLALGEQDTTSITNIDSEQTTVTRSHSETVTVPPGASSYVQLRVWPEVYTLPFTTDVIIEADISANDKGYKLLSDVFPDPKARTFQVSGMLKANDASEGEVVEMGLQYDPTVCSSGDPYFVSDHFVVAKKTKMLRIGAHAATDTTH